MEYGRNHSYNKNKLTKRTAIEYLSDKHPFKYCRRSYKKNKRETDGDDSPCETIEIDSPEVSPRSDGVPRSSPRCKCEADHEGEINSILHKKCPVITLAQQQLQRLLDETDKLICDNRRCCRSLYDFFCICQEFCRKDRFLCVLLFCIGMAFFTGLIFGAASCGSYHGRFNSPILTCVDNFFITHTFSSIEESYRSIV